MSATLPSLSTFVVGGLSLQLLDQRTLACLGLPFYIIGNGRSMGLRPQDFSSRYKISFLDHYFNFFAKYFIS